MTWLPPVRRSRSPRGGVAAHTPGVSAPAASSGTAVHEPPAPTHQRSGAPALHTAPAPHTQRGPFQISRARAGRYTIADETGRQIGTILGDHVIGYTVRTGDRSWRFRELDTVRQALELDLQMEAELHARGQAPERAVSGAA